MYCNQCGKKIPDNAKFCQHCGSAVMADTEAKIEEDIEKIEEKIEKKIEAKIEENVEDKIEANIEKNTEENKEVKVASIKKKLTLPGGKKKWMLVAGAVAALALIILGVNMVKNHQPVLTELPDPEYYFAAVGIDEINEHDDVKQVIIRSNEDVWDYAAGYVNLLKWSGRYDFTQSDEDRYSSGDYMWNFVYNDKDEIKNYYYCQVEVDYYNKSNGRDNYAVWITIHDKDAFELVEKEQYTESDARADFSGTESSDDSDNTSNGAVDNGTVGNGTLDSDNTSNSVITEDNSDNSSDFVEEDDGDDFEVYQAEDIYDNPTPCGVCNRTGDCGTCGGDGYLHSSASDEEDRNCYSCSGSGNCRSCGGDGEL